MTSSPEVDATYGHPGNSSIVVSKPVSVHVFEMVAIVVGFVGTVANGVMLGAMSSSRQIAKEETRLLILNQIVLDLLCCLLLVLTYSLKFANYVYSEDVLDLAVCVVLGSEAMLFGFLANSTSSLLAIALERYLKIVHWSYYRLKYRTWMTKVLLIPVWFIGPIAFGVPVNAFTTRVADGQCIPLTFWADSWMRQLFGGLLFLFDYLLPVLFLIYFYWKIMGVVRAQAKVFPGTVKQNSDWVGTNAFKKQVSVLKTFIVLVACCIVCWTPVQSYFLFINMVGSQIFDALRYFFVFLCFFNVSLNPFIYAARLDPAKTWIRRAASAFRNKFQHRDESTGSGELEQSGSTKF